MSFDKKTLIFPILLVTLGTGWLLTTIGVVPNINWVWTLGIAVLGLLTFVVGGFDKVTVVLGPFLLLASCLSLLRQTGRLQFDVEVPLLVIIAGILLFVARLPIVPLPKWIIPDGESRGPRGEK